MLYQKRMIVAIICIFCSQFFCFIVARRKIYAYNFSGCIQLDPSRYIAYRHVVHCFVAQCYKRHPLVLEYNNDHEYPQYNSQNYASRYNLP